MKNYPNSKSNTAQWVVWTVTSPPDAPVCGHVLLSTTKRPRALRRLIAHLRKQYPDALRIEAEFEPLAVTEADLLQWMDSGQVIQWREARATKGDTFLRYGAPDCGCDGLWSPYYCDDCEKWHEAWRGTCYDVMGGEPWVFDWYCDTDGDWAFEPRCPLHQWTERHADEDWQAAVAVADEYNDATQEDK